MLRGTVERDEAQNEERGCTDQCCGDKGIGPLLPGALEGRGELHEEVPGETRELPVAVSPCTGAEHRHDS